MLLLRGFQAYFHHRITLDFITNELEGQEGCPA
jgi:hypothetical protein